MPSWPWVTAGIAVGAIIGASVAWRRPRHRSVPHGTGAGHESSGRAEDAPGTTRREQEFTAHVSHELRTPIAALLSASEYLASATVDAGKETREAVDIVMRHARRLGVLVEELLELAELGTGDVAIRMEPIYIHRLVEAVLARARRDARIEGQEVVTMSDKRRLERIVSNLVTNAYDHGEGQNVRILVGHDDRHFWISVSDEGPGIPREDVPRLFEHFFQGERTLESRRGGIGMGLPIAMENARLLDGTLHVEAPRRGTRIVAEFPIRSPIHSDAESVMDS
jgi:two-component system sensor histidine kinase MtrB